MAKASTKRRNIRIVAVITVVLLVSLIGTVLVYNQLISTRISLSLSTNQTKVIQGSSSQIQVAVTSFGNAEEVNLKGFSNSSNINCTFEPSIGKSNFTSTLTYSVAGSTLTGKYNITITASSGAQAVNVTSVLSVLSTNVTVSGTASSAALSEPEITSIQKIDFTDTQTGDVTSFGFPFGEQSNNPFGNYTVTLENQHTYKVTISYYRGLTVGNMQPTSDYFTTFTVNATAGQTAITENFT